MSVLSRAEIDGLIAHGSGIDRQTAVVRAFEVLEDALLDTGRMRKKASTGKYESFEQYAERVAVAIGVQLPSGIGDAIRLRNRCNHPPRYIPTVLEASRARDTFYAAADAVLGPVLAPQSAERTTISHPESIRTDGIYVCRYGNESATCIRFQVGYACQIIRVAWFDRRFARTIFRLGELSTSVTVRSGYLSTPDSILRVQGHSFHVQILARDAIRLAGTFPGPRGPVDLSGDYILDHDDLPVDPSQPRSIIDVTDRSIPAITREILAYDSYKSWSAMLIEAFRTIRTGTAAAQAKERVEIPHARSLIESMKSSSTRMEVQTGWHLDRLLEVLESGRDLRAPAWFQANYVTGSYDDWS